MVSFNCRGVARENLSSMLTTMQGEFNWSVLLTQEFTKAVKNPMPSDLDGSLVIADTPTSGVRVPSAVVCPLLAGFVQKDYEICGSVLSFLLKHPVLGDIFFVTAHLDTHTLGIVFP